MPRIKSSRRTSLILSVLIIVFVAWPAWIIMRAKYELGGASLDRQVLGSVPVMAQRAMEQYCTGVTITPQSTWLVGRDEDAEEDAKPKDDVIDLGALAHGNVVATDDKDSNTGSPVAMDLHIGDRPRISYISRLDEHGQFQLLATVDEDACLVATPGGRSIYVLTGLNRNDGDKTTDIEQTLIFRSDDQGKTWTWMREGWLAQAQSLAWELSPYFHGQHEVWVASDVSDGIISSEEDVPSAASTLFYSNDGGQSSVRVALPGALFVHRDKIRDKAPADALWGDVSDGENGYIGVVYGEVSTHVVQFDAQRAAVWISQSFSYGLRDQKYRRTLQVTHYAELRRDGDNWRAGEVRQLDDRVVSKVFDNGMGRVVALMTQPDERRARTAELDTTNLTWKEQDELPTPFSPLDSSSYVRGFWVGRDAMLVNVSSTYRVPRWIYPWSSMPAEFSGDAVYASTDGGRSWKHLAIDGYLGVAGFDAAHDRVIWGSSDWYKSSDSSLYISGLK